MKCSLTAALILTAALSFSQTATFEAADVHVSPPANSQFLQVHSAPSGRYEYRNATMLDLIRAAYNAEAETVFGGPSWLDNDRFDVIAKAPAHSSEDDRRLLLRALLAERFKLATHNDSRPVDVFALTVGKKVLLKPSDNPGPGHCDQAQIPNNPYATLNCTGMSMAEFATQFRQNAGGYVTHPIADLTGLKGAYDFKIEWSGRGRLLQIQAGTDPNAERGISFFTAVEEQLGLKLAADKRPMPVIVVDTVERTPAPNPPGMNASLLAAPTEFDAAVVKVSKPNNPNTRFQPRAGGELNIENAPLRLMIAAAWSLENDQSRVVDAPKWVDSDRFDIVAKTSDFPANSPPPIDSIRVMLRNLLIERFGLAAHMEERPISVWLLAVGKGGSKLKPADPQSRSTCRQAATPGSGSAPLVAMTCTNTTMAQFAAISHQNAGAYIDKLAIDTTALQDGYDFTVSWTPKNLINAAVRTDASADAADPSGGVTFFDAVEKQLGLRFESGKHPAPVLVVEKVAHLTGDN